MADEGYPNFTNGPEPLDLPETTQLTGELTSIKPKSSPKTQFPLLVLCKNEALAVPK